MLYKNNAISKIGMIKHHVLGVLGCVLALTAHAPTAYAQLQSGLVLSHDGVDRTYDLYQPDTAPGTGFPLVIDLHGVTLNSINQRLNSGFRPWPSRRVFTWPGPRA